MVDFSNASLTDWSIDWWVAACFTDWLISDLQNVKKVMYI